MVITIDGLGVNEKSTLAKMISKKINFKMDYIWYYMTNI